MSEEPRLGALIAMGRGKMSGVRSPRWVKILKSMSPVGQLGFARDTRQGPIALAGRGSGKSFTMATKFDSVSDAHPRCNSVFVAVSSERARDIMLPAIWKLNETYGCGITELRGERCVVWPNGYKLLFRGCGDRGECDKRRGTPWVMAGWDEAASIAPGLLEYDIHECVEPRLADYNGQWFVGGTPGPVEIGYWHKLSSGAAGYPVHVWDARTNPYMDAVDFMFKTLNRMQGLPPREKWPAHCETLMDLINDPKCWHLLPAKFVREYLGRWVKDLRALIYKLTAKNNYRELPLQPNHITIGCDLGSYNEDDSELRHLDKAAISVAMSHSSMPSIWMPSSRKLLEVDVDILHHELRQELDKPGREGAAVHLDTASAGKLVELTFRKWGIPIQAAVKGPKLRRIQLVQSAVDNGNFQLKEGECTDLRAESTTLVWNDKRDNHSEICADDGWDSALMAAVPHFGDHTPPPPPEPEPGTPEYVQAQELAEFEQALEDAHDEAVGRVWG